MADFKGVISADNRPYRESLRQSREVADRETAAIARSTRERAEASGRAWEASAAKIGLTWSGAAQAVARGVATVGASLSTGISLARRYGETWEYARDGVTAFDSALASLTSGIGQDLAPLLRDAAGVVSAIRQARDAASTGAYAVGAELLARVNPFSVGSVPGAAGAAALRESIAQAEAHAAARRTEIRATLLGRRRDADLTSQLEIARLTGADTAAIEAALRARQFESSLAPLLEQQRKFNGLGEGYEGIGADIGGLLNSLRETYGKVEAARADADARARATRSEADARALNDLLGNARIAALEAEGNTAEARVARVAAQYERLRAEINGLAGIDADARGNALRQADALEARELLAARREREDGLAPARSIGPGLGGDPGLYTQVFGPRAIYGGGDVKKTADAAQGILAEVRKIARRSPYTVLAP